MSEKVLAGQRAIITGASSGIGAATVRRFTAAGARVWAAGGYNQDRLSALLKDCGDAAGGACYDLTGARRAIGLVQDGVKFLGGLDILVNCAAMRCHKPFTDFTDEDVDALFEVNAKAAFLASREAVKVMLPQKSGRILMIGSIDGQRGVPGNALYCATKVSMHSLTRALAVELGPHGLRVNALLPGTTESERMAAIHEARPDYAASKLPNIPARRFATVDEMAATAVFMVSKDNDFMNGACIVSDGGVRAQ